MSLLQQVLFGVQTLTEDTWTSAITLPAGCGCVVITLDVDPADIASEKTLELHGYSSIDGGQTWVEQGGLVWSGPGTGAVELGSSCHGYDGMMLKALIVPDPSGITLSASVKVE